MSTAAGATTFRPLGGGDHVRKKKFSGLRASACGTCDGWGTLPGCASGQGRHCSTCNGTGQRR